MAPVIEHVAIGQTHGIAQQPIAHAAAIHEPELLIGLRARGGRQPHPAAQSPRVLRRCVRASACGRNSAPRTAPRRAAPPSIVDRRRIKHAALAMSQPKADIEARERQPFHPAHDVAELGGVAADEFAPRRHVEKELADLDAGARRDAPRAATADTLPPSTLTSAACSAPRGRDTRRRRETEPIEGSASPRNPSVATAARSASDAILLVAWRASAMRQLLRAHP